MAADYDVFLSHAWADGERPQRIADALTNAGLRVWFDAAEINDFASITRGVTEGLAKSKALLAYYSKTYPLRRACQWELTAAFLAAQSESDPRDRVLVINPEKDADHIHPIELRDAKFLSAPNTEGEMQQLVQAVLKHVAELSGPLPDIHALDVPVWHGTKPVRYERFVGRFQEMWKIHSALHDTAVVQVTGASGQDIAQLTGLGGIGKSLLAREYALRFGPAYPGGVFWMSAYGNDDMKASLSEEGREAERNDQLSKFAQDLGIDVIGKQPNEVLRVLRLGLERRGQPCLWIVDDLPSGLNYEAFQFWCAPHPLARTLITTRCRNYSDLGSSETLSLDVLPRDDAYQLLTSRRLPAGKDEEEQARELARDLGYHALALDVTGSALLSYGESEPYRRFREELANPDEDALELAKDLADSLPNGHQTSIAKTLLRSILGVGFEGRDFLRLASVLAVAPIPASLAKAVFERVDHISHWDAQWRAVKGFHQVTSASLAEIAGEQQEARSVHTLVSRTMRFHEKAAPMRAQALRAAAVEALQAEIAKVANDPSLHKQIEFHVAHARQVVTMPESLPEAGLVSWLARHDEARGSYASARTLHERVLEFCRRTQGPEHPLTVIVMVSIGHTLNRMGDLRNARNLQEETLRIARYVLGAEHPDTLSSMNNLAVTIKAQGDLVGARELQEETLDIRRRVLGPEHPDTLSSMNNLAIVLDAQGELEGARKLLEETLAVKRRVLGPEHPDTLTSMDTLNTILSAQGDLAGARKLQEEVLDIRSRVLGPEHPNTLTSMNNLAIVLIAQGELEGARKLLEETLAVKRRVLGPEHPDTLTSMDSLNMILSAQGDLAVARKLQEEVLHIRGRVLGPDHPDTLTSMGNLAIVLSAQGELEGARTINEQTLDIRRRALGTEHPATLTSMGNLAAVMQAQGDSKGARELEEKVLEVRRRVLGAEHRDTLGSINNLAIVLSAQGELEGARKLQEEVLAVWRRVLGPEHPNTLTSMSNLAVTLSSQGDLAGACKLQKEVLEISRRDLGPLHAATSRSAWNLFCTLNHLGDRSEGSTVFEHNLLWLLDRDPTTLGADQRKIRENVIQMVKSNG